jgi:hypothetical protein
MEKSRFTLRKSLSLLGVFALFVILRWNSFAAPLDRDEGAYAYEAKVLAEGGLPYRDALTNKPPLIYYTFLLSRLMSPEVYWLPRLFSFVFTMLTTVVLGLIAEKEFGRSYKLKVMWIATPMLALSDLAPFSANTEVFMLLPYVASLAVYIRKRKENSQWSWFVFGLLGTIAVFYKPICVFVIVFVALVWLVDEWRANKRVDVILSRTISAFVGGLLVTLVALTPFLLEDSGQSFFEAVRFSYYYLRSFPFDTGNIKVMAIQFFVRWPLAMMLIGFFVVKRPPRWWFYLGLLLTSLLGVYRSYLPHYYFLIIPTWALICTRTTGLLAEATRKYIPKVSLGRLAALFTAVLVMFLLLPSIWIIDMSPTEYNEVVHGNDNPFNESLEVAKHVSKLTGHDDYVYVAGSEPQVLYYSDRKSASRFITTYPLLVPSPWREDYQKEVLNDLTTKRPKVIVYSMIQSSWARGEYVPTSFINGLDSIINDDYKLAGSYRGGFLIYERNGRNER